MQQNPIRSDHGRDRRHRPPHRPPPRAPGLRVIATGRRADALATLLAEGKGCALDVWSST